MQAEYSLRLTRDGRSEPARSPMELADLVANLPPGCALWRATGGPLAWTGEMHLLSVIEHDLSILAWMKTEDGKNGRNRPVPIEPPGNQLEARQAQAKSDAKALAWQRRQQRRA